jgi:hypothetical protein
VVGFITGVIGTQFIVAQVPSRLVAFFGATVLHAAIFIGLYAVLGLREVESPYWGVVGQGIGNALVGVLLFQFTEMLPGAMEKRRLGRGRQRS